MSPEGRGQRESEQAGDGLRHDGRRRGGRGEGGRVRRRVLTDLNPAFLPSPRFEDTGLTVIDHATGLEWEKKTEDGGVHDRHNLYQLSDSSDGDLADPDGDAFTVFVAALNDCVSADGRSVSGGFAGHCDWRLPQVDELLTVLDTAPRPLPSHGGESVQRPVTYPERSG